MGRIAIIILDNGAVVIIIVDAYNVLKQVAHDLWISDRERDLFIKMLGSYAKKRGHQILAVFDGGDSERATLERLYGVQVVYSGFHESADQYIKRSIEKYRQYEVLLISSDREIAEWADRHQIESIDSLEFYKIVRQTVQKNKSGDRTSGPGAIKTTESTNEELDQLMSQQSSRAIEKNEMVEQRRISTNRQVSKKEKQMIKKIKKL
jgi:predicted RNA-binding protein with PIN domain